MTTVSHGFTFTRGRPSDVDTWEPLGEHSAALYSHIIFSDELPPAFEAVVGSWVSLEEGALIVEPCEQTFGAAIRRHAAHIGDLNQGLVDHLVCLTVSACLVVCGSFTMPSRPSLPPVPLARVVLLALIASECLSMRLMASFIRCTRAAAHAARAAQRALQAYPARVRDPSRPGRGRSS